VPNALVLRFEVVGWDPVELADVDPGWAAAATMRKSYTAGLLGTGVVHFVSSGDETSGRAYVAVERVEGILDDGRRGAFTVQHGALQAPGGVEHFGWVVPRSGTGDLAALGGAARIQHDEQGASLVLDDAWT
jgi:hypothetical protein